MTITCAAFANFAYYFRKYMGTCLLSKLIFEVKAC
jgi:hypothetical protein